MTLKPMNLTGKEANQLDESMKTCALYMRVSTGDQSAQNQLPELQAYAKMKGWTIAGVYTDEGISGKARSRPAFDSMMRDARKRKFDVLVCWKLDRVGRSVSHLYQTVEELRGLGIEFAATTQGVDTSTSTGKMIFGMLAVIAEFELDLISERTKIGVQVARTNGKTLGRPVTFIDAEKLTGMRARGLSKRRMARELNVPLTTLRRRLA